MYDLNALYYFAQIVDHGGFGAASRATGVSKSRLSRSIQELETYLAARLINRSTRHFAVTDLGQEFYVHCQQVLSASEAARASVEKKQVLPQGTVRISCPTALLNFVVAGMISRFMTRFPLVKVQIVSTNREVDVLREGLDLALHVKTPPFEDSGLVMKRLSRSPQELVASPQFLQQHAPRISARTQQAAKPALGTATLRLLLGAARAGSAIAANPAHAKAGYRRHHHHPPLGT